MKLLLTSAGITNQSIANALFELVGKKPQDTNLVFIPTAANGEIGDKMWFIDGLIHLKEMGFKSIEITDISAVDESIWRPSLEQGDILFFGGGSVFHLMKAINKSGLKDILPELLKTKVFLGDSAGSAVLNKTISFRISQTVYEEDFDETQDIAGLQYVDFNFLPHLNSEYFTKVRKENIEKATEGMTDKIYCMDDNGAIKVTDGKVEIVTEGEYLEYN